MSRESIAYFTMEIGLESSLPTYSGGLGVLAGDTVQAAANARLPMVGVSLLHRKGYFYQRLDETGWQSEDSVEWSVDDFLEEVPERTTVSIEERSVTVRAWRYDVTGHGDHVVPVYFLDTDLPENTGDDRVLTHFLYGGESYYRLCQEVILGIGGVRMLRELGYHHISNFHMNEGHASLLTLELLRESAADGGEISPSGKEIEDVRNKCVFTTHTPVAAGHDKFTPELVNQVLGDQTANMIHEQWFHDGAYNMTYLGLNLSHYINGVAKKHKEVARLMFADYPIESITNGVEVERWTLPELQQLFNQYIPGWQEDSFSLRYALSIPKEELWETHQQVKKKLLHYVNRETNAGMDLDVFTIGYARRATEYKRMTLLIRDRKRLQMLVHKYGSLQIIFAGKAHPRDQGGKRLIQHIFEAQKNLHPDVQIAYLPNYDMEIAQLMVAGTDLWLNTPDPPLEASGTSGMKAAINGVPSLSILDGWWIEGCIEGVTGWAIAGSNDGSSDADDQDRKDADALYTKLEEVIVPMYYDNRSGYTDIMRHAIALNGSFFNTQRMMQEYIARAYF